MKLIGTKMQITAAVNAREKFDIAFEEAISFVIEEEDEESIEALHLLKKELDALVSAEAVSHFCDWIDVEYYANDDDYRKNHGQIIIRNAKNFGVEYK